MTELTDILKRIVSNTHLHARWLNTLSLMENTGARKISAAEHSTEVSITELKHAAEEARHAYYLKKQISKLASENLTDYTAPYLIAPLESRNYLHQLDVGVCRYLKQQLGFSGQKLRFAAYLLVTYAIEVRADELYPNYQQILDAYSSKVNVKSIILEEETHLQEMQEQMALFFEAWEPHAQHACELEEVLYRKWLTSVAEEVAE